MPDDTISALDEFIACDGDETRLAMGLERLRAARDEAEAQMLTGWSIQIYEYVLALEDGRGLNRPL